VPVTQGYVVEILSHNFTITISKFWLIISKFRDNFEETRAVRARSL